MTGILIRGEHSTEHRSIEKLLDEAIAGEPVGRLVADLRRDGDLHLSLVAEVEGTLAGYIGFSPVAIAGPRARVYQLSPLAVDARFRRRGIGSMLVRTGLDRCRELDADAVLVLGNPAYYTRFGFDPALASRLRTRWAGPHLMGIEFTPGVLTQVSFLALAPAFELLP